MKGKFCVLFIVLCFSIHGSGEIFFSIQNITSREGLPQNTISSIIQDSQGFLWFGTLNGLSRYDGTEFFVFLPEFGSRMSLSDSRIKSIREDRDGYLWIQTNNNNINCYNPKLERFVDFHPTSRNHENIFVASNGDVWLWGNNSGCLVVTHNSAGIRTRFFDIDHLGGESVLFVREGPGQSIWIGTHSQLFRYKEQELMAITRSELLTVEGAGEKLCLFTPGNKVILMDVKSGVFLDTLFIDVKEKALFVNKIVRISPDTILILANKGAYILNTESFVISSARHLFGGENLVNADFLRDNKSDVWLFNMSGNIWQYDKIKQVFNKIELIPPAILSHIDLERYAVYHDGRDVIWITTYGNGLFALNQASGKIIHLKHTKGQSGGLRTNFLLTVSGDSSGEIWVGTEYAGLSKISPVIPRARLFFPGKSADSKASNAIVRLIHQDSDSNLWIGTKSGDLYVYNRDFSSLLWQYSIKGGLPYALAEDTLGNIWVGTKGKGLFIFDRSYNQLWPTPDIAEGYKSSISSIYAVCRDFEGRIWLGTFGRGIVLAEYRSGRVTYRQFPELEKVQSKVRTILQDETGYIWIGGNSGLTVFHPDEIISDGKRFFSFGYNSQDSQSISNNEVKTIFKDSRGTLWLGTSGGGLNQVVKGSTPENTKFRHFTTENGLLNNIIQGINEDEDRNLWISTESGISKFNMNALTFENFSMSDSWEGNLFCESSSFKRDNGDILFGSHNGLYIIEPDETDQNQVCPPVCLTAFEINGQKVLPSDSGSPLKCSISVTKEITLNYSQNSFSIHYAIPDYVHPEANSYTYILEGFENNWNSVTRHNVATYRNLGPGIYTFKVKGKNSLGVWHPYETTLKINVKSPVWLTRLAFVFYAVFLTAIILIITTTIRKIDHLNNLVKIEQRLTEYKLHFFTNISHEFRTPLTIIRGTIDNLRSQKNVSPHVKQQIGFLEKSSIRLLRLVDQLLEFRKLQNDKIQISPEHIEIVSFLRGLLKAFEEPAQRKKIQFSFNTSQSSLEVLLDRNVIDKAVFNLLSNAFKFTPEGGTVTVKLEVFSERQMLEISVEDNGAGVPKDRQHLLFTRFKQLQASVPGTGIGLNLAYELVRAHHGIISYRDAAGGGACFTITIPLAVNIQQPIIDSVPDVLFPQEKGALELESEMSNWTVKQKVEECKKKRILIIEDDPEISDYLVIQLGESFLIDTAQNGAKGLEMGMEIQPNLIICDVMMPGLNGFEVTQRLKSEFSTCHIPIILLTAYVSERHQITGFEVGADAYITKPFSFRHLYIRIIKLLEQRETLQQKYAKTPGLVDLPEFSVDRDKEFLNSVHLVIEKNMDDPTFSVETIVESTRMGRTAFYQKIKGLTGASPNELIKIIRLKKAAELLVTTDMNIAETAYKVGLSNPFYFSKCFKSTFGLTPSEFRKSHSGDNESVDLDLS